MDKGELVGAVYIDFSAAFDLVDHQLLLSKLRSYGFSEDSLMWMRSYLHERTQVVYINGHFSEPSVLECGIPQGSCLGPLMFTLYTNDLPLSVSNSTTEMYADDTSMYKAARSIAEITAALQPDLNMVLEWVIRNKLVMNVLKTKCMVFGSPRKLALLPSNSLNLVIGTDSIEQVKETVLLGLHMDQSLTWNLHTNHVVAKQSKNIALLRRHAWAMSHEICKMVVCALVLSVAQYCLLVLANMSELNTSSCTEQGM